MNYRHAFHAGNFADVHKHVVLLGLLDAFERKDTPFFVLDTHAGRGRYELDSDESTRTGEAFAGVRRLRDLGSTQAALSRYLDAVAAHNRASELRIYPGSPLLAAAAMRAQDRLVCCELQEQEAAALGVLFAEDARVAVHRRDGYEALRAFLPPKERRGLVLIDPPYEALDAEFDRAIEALQTGLQRWPQGVFVLWYPIKQRRTLAPFLRKAGGLPARTALRAELLVRPADSPLRMNGSGLLLLNAPWQYDAELREALPALAEALGEQRPDWLLEWLKQETTT